MDIKPPCGTCDYFNKIETDGDGTTVGECRRKSPIPINIDSVALKKIGTDVGDLIPFAAWPRVFDDSWCGKHSRWGTPPLRPQQFSTGQD